MLIIEDIAGQLSEVDFPSVTICNLNKVMEKLDAIVFIQSYANCFIWQTFFHPVLQVQVSQIHRMGVQEGSQEFHYFLESFLAGEGGSAPGGWAAALARGEARLRWNSSMQPFIQLPGSSQVNIAKFRFTHFCQISFGQPSNPRAYTSHFRTWKLLKKPGKKIGPPCLWRSFCEK